MYLHIVVFDAVAACYLVGGLLQLLKSYFAAGTKIVFFTTNLETVFSCLVVTNYTECYRINVREFGRVFLILNYTDITQNTYIQS